LNFHRGYYSAAAEKSSCQVGIDDGVPVGQREFFSFVPVHAAAGDVDQNVDAAMVRNNFLKAGLYVYFLRHVEANECRLLASALEFGRYLPSTFFIDVENQGSEIVPNEAFNDGVPDP
jgi:hypothetical protein